jgi:hypothetical protein
MHYYCRFYVEVNGKLQAPAALTQGRFYSYPLNRQVN